MAKQIIHFWKMFPDLSGSVRQDKEEYIPHRDSMKHSSHLTSDLLAWVRQPHHSQLAGRKRGNIGPRYRKFKQSSLIIIKELSLVCW